MISTDMKEAILSRLSPEYPWKDRLQFFPSIDSTNDRLKKMARQGAPHGTVLLADHQTGGHGRMGRSFHSPEGSGIYLSILLRPQCAPADLMHLTCAAAVAMCDAVEAAVGLRPGIKWTNDLVFGKRKLAGILTELVTTGSTTYAIIGIGINCCQTEDDFPDEIRGFAGSLAMVCGRSVDPAAVAAALVEALYDMSAQLLSRKADIMARYSENCVTVGQDISILRSDEVRHGHAVGVDGEGALLVRFPDGSTEAVNSGEVSIRGMYGYI